MYATAHTQVLEVRERLGERESLLEEHQVAVEQAARDHEGGGRAVPHHRLEAAAQSQRVMRGDRACALGPLVERTAVPWEHQRRFELRDLLERVEELAQRVGRWSG